MTHPPPIVGIGRKAAPGSSTETALSIARSAGAADGERTRMFDGAMLAAVAHSAGSASVPDVAADLVGSVPAADGLIATDYGWQASGTALAASRAVVHALRGRPTPVGVGLNCADGLFHDGGCIDPAVTERLGVVGRQVLEFAQLQQSRNASVAA